MPQYESNEMHSISHLRHFIDAKQGKVISVFKLIQRSMKTILF